MVLDGFDILKLKDVSLSRNQYILRFSVIYALLISVYIYNPQK